MTWANGWMGESIQMPTRHWGLSSAKDWASCVMSGSNTCGSKTASVGGELSTRKVPGSSNPADLLTKHVAAADIHKHAEDICMELLDGRAASAPTLAVATAAGNIEGLRNEFNPEGKPVDSWQQDAMGPIRVHGRPRRCLFTPMRVEGAPPARALTATRVTRGTYLNSGKAFEVVDNWTTRSTAHAELREPWVGHTKFLSRNSSNA